MFVVGFNLVQQLYRRRDWPYSTHTHTRVRFK